MPNPADVAIQKAMVDHLVAMCQSPEIPLSLPSVKFTMPAAGQDVFWLRATFLPAPTLELGVDYTSTNQHWGILQVDVFYGEGGGDYPAGRIAADVIAWFHRGTRLTQDGFGVEVTKPPRRGRVVKDSPWIMVPVTIPYLAFASNPS